jgi:FixJ family two-component response regulator
MNHPLEVLDAMREKVLIVEDDALIALSMREILTLVGFEVAAWPRPSAML